MTKIEKILKIIERSRTAKIAYYKQPANRFLVIKEIYCPEVNVDEKYKTTSDDQKKAALMLDMVLTRLEFQQQEPDQCEDCLEHLCHGCHAKFGPNEVCPNYNPIGDD